MKVNKSVIDKIINHEGYSRVKLFDVSLNNEIYSFFINKLVSWVDNSDRQFLSVRHYTSKEQQAADSWNNRIIFNTDNIPYSTLDMVYLNSKEKRILNKYANDIQEKLPYFL